MKKEQRSFRRRIPIGNLYAALGRDYERVGKIVDLSRGGLAFEYISDDNQIAEFSQIAIFKVGEVFHLHNLPCKIVYDILFDQQRNGIESLKRSRDRRCGIEFKALPEEDYTQLTMFIECNTKAVP